MILPRISQTFIYFFILQKFKDGMGFAIDQNSANGQNKNYLKNMIPGAHLHNSLYSDIPG